MKRARTLPTLLGLLLLMGGAVVGVVGIRQGQTWLAKASPEEQPKEVRITNLSDQGFSVSWITDTAVRGFVKYGDAGGALPSVAEDEKDEGKSSQGTYEIHYVNIKGLKGATAYEFKIGSGKRLYDDSGRPFATNTAVLTQDSGAATDIVSGLVVSSEQPLSGAVVYLENERLTALSTTVKSTGTFTIALSRARLKNLKDVWAGPEDGETFDLLVEGAGRGKATATVNMKNRDGVPEISVPGDYDFSAELPRDEAGAIILPTGSPTPSVGSGETAVIPTQIPGSKFSFKNLPTPTESEEITVIYPSTSESVSVTQPEFSGAAPPGKSLTITVQSTPQSGQVVADANGEWRWTPPAGLEPGEHTITISYVDKAGILQKLVRKFVVSAEASEGAAGNSGDLAFTASPSATLAPSASPTISTTPEPTVEVTPEATPTQRAALPATESGIPKAGTVEVTIMLLAMGVLLVGAGAVMVRSVKSA